MVCAVTMIGLPVHYGRLTDIFVVVVVVVVAVAKIDLTYLLLLLLPLLRLIHLFTVVGRRMVFFITLINHFHRCVNSPTNVCFVFPITMINLNSSLFLSLCSPSSDFPPSL